MKHLGIDFGTKKVGLAVSDDNGSIAFPRQIIPNNKELVATICSFVEKEEITVIVIGKSLDESGDENIVQKHIDQFSKKLTEHLPSGVTLIHQDERGSSVAARSHLYTKGNIANERWTGNENKKKREAVDAGAAAVILQRYLDRTNQGQLAREGGFSYTDWYMNYVSYDAFKEMDMRLGLIRYVEPVEGTDKLLRFEIDFGEMIPRSISCTGTCLSVIDDCEECDEARSCMIHCECTKEREAELPFGKEEYANRDIRQIVSGVREFFPEYESLVGKHGLYILNLEPREIKGVMSHGMLMAVDGVDGTPVFLEPRGEVHPGAKVR